MRRYLAVRQKEVRRSPSTRFVAGRFLLFTILPICLFWTPGLEGQAIQELGQGDRVRMTPLDGGRTTGAFQGLGASGLSVLDSSGSPFTIPLSSLRALEVAAGRNRMKGALYGGVVGLVAGVLLGGATSGDCVGDCDDPYGVGGGDLVESNAIATGAILGGVILGGVGALVGARFFAPERWIGIDLGPSGRILPIPLGRR